MVAIRASSPDYLGVTMTRGIAHPGDPLSNLVIGTIIEVTGTRVVAELDPELHELTRVYAGDSYPIGQFGSIIRVHYGRRLIYAFVRRLRMKTDYDAERGLTSSAEADARVIEADLFGEGSWHTSESNDYHLVFERGVSTYPLPKQRVYLTPKKELRSIYERNTKAVIQIGEHVGSGGVPCFAEINELIGKHTAILGSTGTGKSAAVAVVLHALIDRGPDTGKTSWAPRILVLDPHNEYSTAFPNSLRLSTDDGSLTLPYWMLNFQETIALYIGKTEHAATSQTNIVKQALIKARNEGAVRLEIDCNSITVDSPVPYDLDTLYAEIDADKPPQASKQDSHNSILQKIDVLRSDGRMDFLMKNWTNYEYDPLFDVIDQLISTDKQPRIVDLSGVPNDVAGIASSVIARTLFNLKVWQSEDERAREPLLLVCEEAHRYVPNIGEAQYEAAQESIRRIAKEGRKYGIGLILVSQRPSEVEATVLSQCNSWVVLRVTNESDRNHVRNVLPDSMGGLSAILSGMRRREAVFVGQAATLPSRIMINDLQADKLPMSHDVDFEQGWQAKPLSSEEVGNVAKRWRYQRRLTGEQSLS